MGCLVQESHGEAPSSFGSTTPTQQQAQFGQLQEHINVTEYQLSTSGSAVHQVVQPVPNDQYCQMAISDRSFFAGVASPQQTASMTQPDDRMSISNLVTAEALTSIITTEHTPYVESAQEGSPLKPAAPEQLQLFESTSTSSSGPKLEDLFSDEDSNRTEVSEKYNPPSDEYEDEEDSEEEEDGEPIEPDHYYGGTVPVFRPTMQQFRSFPKFIKKIDNYGMRVGIVKVIPPPEWATALPDVGEKLKSIRIRQPIVQHINGSQGVFSQTNIEKQRSYSLPQWRKVTEESDHQPPARRGERRKGHDSKLKLSPRKRQRVVYSAAESSADGAEGSDTRQKVKRRNGEHSPQELAEFESFDYRFDASEFTPGRCEELEKIYWKTITYNNPMYGADLLGSLFSDATKEWNVAHLDNILNELGMDLPGVNTAYLYFGMWKSTFSWHVEDMDLYSINYLHFGAPKQWYSISQQDETRFFNVMRSEWPDEHKKCKEFLRHKTFLVSPRYLADHGIKVNKLVHNQGEFVITFPFGYHSGYNLGYNCAESVNFATERWLQIGARAKKCKCVSDAVGIDVQDLAYRLKMKKRQARQMKREMEQKQLNGAISAATSQDTEPDTFTTIHTDARETGMAQASRILSKDLNGLAPAPGTLAVTPATVSDEMPHVPVVAHDVIPELFCFRERQNLTNSPTISIVDR
ncbi:JmjC domain, hydroxylase-domain-containing protein [Lipomyces kononenkoae]|uniref:JmjC domain, hydroxylase-domain-containing protein n=1 Tax=Lipomyces kononenkoae TaxID=34357 RepID=A0ACC3SXJ3_LIPKO